MTYQELYDSALRLVSETCRASDGEQILENEDYRERAEYILATFCNECAPLDKKYREIHHAAAAVPYTPVTSVSLNSNFPLKEIFAHAAVYYLGAMLVSDENESLCDRLFDLYTDAISSIQSNLPYATESIVNRYADLT